MKRLIMLACGALVVFTAGAIAAQAPRVSFVSADKVAAALAKSGSLATAPGVLVSGNHRQVPGQVEVHDTETDVFYIVEGTATIVTGGTMVGGKQTAAGQHRGSDIKGGESRQLSKGDVMVIPAGIPHWFKEVSPTINYFTVKVLKHS